MMISVLCNAFHAIVQSIALSRMGKKDRVYYLLINPLYPFLKSYLFITFRTIYLIYKSRFKMETYITEYKD